MNANILVETEGLSREEWLAWRRKGIGGSDVGAVLGISKWKSTMGVWLDKTGQMPDEDEPSEAMRWGNIMEPIIRNHFREVTGKPVAEVPAILQSREHPFMIADVDGVTVDDDGNPAILEIKTANEFQRPLWEDHVPNGYTLQVMHYLSVCGLAKAYVAVLIGGNTFKIMEVDADPRIQELIIGAEEAFWKLVTHRQKPSMDGSDASTELLGRMFKGGDKETLTLPEESAALVDAYLEASKAEGRAKERKQAAANRLKEVMKNHDRASCGRHTVSWIPVKSEKFDTKGFKLAEPELYRKYAKESTYRRFSVK